MTFLGSSIAEANAD